MPHPDDFNPRAFDAAHGTSDDDQGEILHVKVTLARMRDVMNMLYVVESSNSYLTEACHAAGEALEQWASNIEVHLP